MACEPALGAAWIKFGRLKRVGRWVISPLGICPSVRVRKSLGVLFDEGKRFQGIRHVDEIGGHRIPFERPLDLCDLGAVGEKLAVAGKTAPESLHHYGVGDDHLDRGLGLADGDVLPLFVAPEGRKPTPSRYFQLVPVLQCNGRSGQDREMYLYNSCS